MAVGMRLTKAGEKVIAQGLAGEEIKFTRVILGDSDFDYNLESVYQLTAVKSPRMDLKITSVKVTGDGTTTLTTYNSNVDVVEGFPAKEHGVMAMDSVTGEEILFCYRCVNEEYDFIASNKSNIVKNIAFAYVIVTKDCTNITAVIDSSFAYVSTQNFTDHVNAVVPHPNAPSLMLDVTETDHIWATDKDKHLHRISVANLKDSLTQEITASGGGDIELIKAREKLGIDANILLIEDFTMPEEVDTFKTKVTSSAKGGNLLGLASADGLITGGYYWIGDGVNQELIKVVSVILNVSGLHARLERGLDNSYDAANTYLYRTTAQFENAIATGAIDAKEFSWTPNEKFEGIPANIERTLALETTASKSRDFIIEGAGVLTDSGYFTLK